jgi:citrate synthase
VLALGTADEEPRNLVRRLASAPALARRDFERSRCADSVAEATLVALGGATDAARVRAVDEALILCADHELNPSSFAARVAASVGASLTKSTLAAVATFSGPLHGGACERIESFVSRLGRPEHAIRAVSEELAAGRSVPGFGHPLYPKGDPRALPLLERAQELGAKCERVRALLAVVDAMALAEQAQPTLDAGLVALGYALELPPGAASGLFAIGRSAGWIAHALEQREAGFVLRPRARYAPNV